LTLYPFESFELSSFPLILLFPSLFVAFFLFLSSYPSSLPPLLSLFILATFLPGIELRFALSSVFNLPPTWSSFLALTLYLLTAPPSSFFMPTLFRVLVSVDLPAF